MTFLRPLVQAAVTRNSFIQSAQPLACIHHTFHQSSGSSNQSTEIRRKINTAFCHGNHSMQCLEKKQKHSWKPSYSTISHDHILQSRIAKFQHKHSSYFCNTQSQLYASKEEEIEPTWTYEPYKPPPKKSKKSKKSSQPTKRYYSSSSSDNWTVPKTLSIPLDQLEFSFVRSSGAGGQNVNKLSTKVELRFHVSSANWIPFEVRQRLSSQNANRMNKEGYMTLNSQEFRTQAMNKKDVVNKLEDLVLLAYPRPKVRKMRKGVSQAAKRRNLEDKKRRSSTKQNRKRVDF